MKKALKILAFPLCCSLALSGIAGGGFLRTDRKALAETTAQNAQELIDGAKNGDTGKTRKRLFVGVDRSRRAGHHAGFKRQYARRDLDE